MRFKVLGLKGQTNVEQSVIDRVVFVNKAGHVVFKITNRDEYQFQKYSFSMKWKCLGERLDFLIGI
jgi:hypothetical protein